MARQEGLEPPTYCLEGSCSIRLSYWRIIDGAGDGNRTRVSSLEGWCSTIELHPHSSASRIQLVNSNIDLFGCQAPKWFFIMGWPFSSQINCNLAYRNRRAPWLPLWGSRLPPMGQTERATQFGFKLLRSFLRHPLSQPVRLTALPKGEPRRCYRISPPNYNLLSCRGLTLGLPLV